MVAAPAANRESMDSQFHLSLSQCAINANEFEHSISQHSARWHAIARQILGNDDRAADAVQEAYLAALRARPRFRGESQLSTWMHRIVVNVCLMRLRFAKRHGAGSLDALSATCDCEDRAGATCLRPELAYERQELRNQVRRCIDHLPPDFRTILLLRDIEELDTDETARKLDISRSAVKTRLHRARQALRLLLEQEAEEYCLPA